MKTLVVMRHAEAEPFMTVGNDRDRLISPKGHQQLVAVANEFECLNMSLDHIFASSAQRTVTTSEYLSKFSKSAVEYVPELYNATGLNLENFIFSIEDSLNSVAIIGHNPAVSECVSALLNSPVYFNPSNAMVLGFDVSRWSEMGSTKLKSEKWIAV